jgi:adenylate cyclase
LLTGPIKDRSFFDNSVALLNQAVALDPEYGEPYAGLAMAYNLDYHNRWTDDPDGSLKQAMAFADLAVKKAPESAFAHYVASIVAGFLRDFDRAEQEIEAALALGPNFAMAINAKGAKALFSTNPEDAIPLIEQAMRLDPAFAHQYLHFLGLAHLLLGKFETAEAELRERVRLVPETDLSRVYLASVLGHLGRAEEAGRVWQELMTINPKYAFEAHVGRLPFRNPRDAAPIREGLRKAGLA